MTWRTFAFESVTPRGDLLHTLECGHTKRALNALRTGRPVAAQWCTECSPSRIAKPQYVAVRREHIEYALAVLGECHDSGPRCDAAILAFETALRRTAQNHDRLVQSGFVEMTDDTGGS